jgi:hypothetical protein
VGLPIPNDMERPEKTNKDFVAVIATRLLFGNNLMLKDSKKNTGLNYGSKKATQLGNYVCFRATVNQSLNGSRIIGLKDCLMSTQITHSTNASFMMELTSIKTVV